MSTFTATKLVDEALPTASATLYTAPSGVIVKEIILVNTTAGSATVTITCGGLMLIPGITLNPNSFTSFDFSKVLANGDIVAGLASVAGVNIFMSGVVIS